MTSCTSACVNMPCFTALVVITDMFPLYASPSHGYGCVYLAFPRFCLAVMIDLLRYGCLFICRSAVSVTRCLDCSVFISIVANNCSGAPQRMSSHTDTLQQRICPCVACISSYVRNLVWYLSLLQLCITGSLDGLVGLRQSADVLAGELG